MIEYEPVIGLEVHLQLATKTKVFCSCKNEFGAPPNTQTCPVCLGLPGVLPVLNKQALDYGIKVALALNCQIAEIIKFDRKNYYYPDLPKNYQISQFDKPIGHDGYLEVMVNDVKRNIKIKRVHLEEDAGKLIHEEGGDATLVDFNRTGVSLLEIVTDPDIFSSDEAYAYLSSLKSILEYLDVSTCNMEEGSLRCDANLSLRPKGTSGLGVKTEVKNMNSFKGVRAALEYEIVRQNDVLGDHEKVIQETRLWDANKQITLSMRTKEAAHDYRYFPDPDLVPFTVDKESINAIKKTIPELPKQKAERFIKEYELSEYNAQVLTTDKTTAHYFESTVKEYSKNSKAIANWIMGDIQAYLNEQGLSLQDLLDKLPAKHLAKLILLIDQQVISNKIAKKVLFEMIQSGLNADKIVEKQGLKQISDRGDLENVADEILDENASVVEDLCNGKEKAFSFLVGKFMAKTKGKANPNIATEILKDKINIIKENKMEN